MMTFAPSGYAQNVLRGPYLQKPTHESIIVMWRTDVATNSEVKYGDSPNHLNQTVTLNPLVTDHEVQITGLEPFTKYYYSVGRTGLVLEGGNEQHHFVTSPLRGTVQPIKTWAIGDFGKSNNGQRAARDAYINHMNGAHTDVWLWLGDNAYQDGTDQEYQDKVFDPYWGYDTLFRFMPFMPTPGNHDYNSVNRLADPVNHVGPYYNIVEVPRYAEAGGFASGYELYYSYDYGNAHFISLNSELQAYTFETGSPMEQWLINDLQQNDKEWIIVYWHQPPYSKGSHDSDAFWELFMIKMRENYLPILEQYGVDLVVCGHSHVFERSKLIHGHYGYSFSLTPAMVLDDGSGNFAAGTPYAKTLTGANAGKGTVYVVCGNSGSDNDDGSLNHPIMYFNDNGNDVTGSFLIEIFGNRLDGKYLRFDGQILDEFTIVKPDGGYGLINVEAKALLEGAFDETSGLMRTDLRTANKLPLSQPFGGAPWNYSGTESVANLNDIPTNATDWVLIELRNPDGSLAGQKAAFILNDGTITDIDSRVKGVQFSQGITMTKQYHLVVRSRNHVDVMSAQPISVPTLGQVFDFTLGNNVKGTDQMIQLANGSHALVAGDVDGNGSVTAEDYNLFETHKAIHNPYLQGDVNLDGLLDNDDFDLILKNKGHIASTPVRY